MRPDGLKIYHSNLPLQTPETEGQRGWMDFKDTLTNSQNGVSGFDSLSSILFQSSFWPKKKKKIEGVKIVIKCLP